MRTDPEALDAHGIGPGPDRARLAGGEALGAVAPGQVSGPARRGRRIVYSGDTRPAPGIARAAESHDLVILRSQRRVVAGLPIPASDRVNRLLLRLDRPVLVISDPLH